MSQINPFTGAIIQSTQVQQTKSSAQDKHIRRVQNLSKNAGLTGDTLEHQVESTDALHPSGDWLAGQNGDDQLFGEGGNDRLDGGLGADALHGNAGDDSFFSFDNGEVDSLFGDRGQDTTTADDTDLLTGIETLAPPS